MANEEMVCTLPNGDVLTTTYDGEKLVVVVDTKGSIVFNRQFSHLDLTGDQAFAVKMPEEPSDSQPRNGRFAGGVHLGPDE